MDTNKEIVKGSLVVLIDSKDRHYYRVIKIEGNNVSLYRFAKSAGANIETTLDKIKLYEIR